MATEHDTEAESRRVQPREAKRPGAAKRQSAYRARRARGEMVVPCILALGVVDRLVDLGWLADDQRRDTAAVKKAIEGFVVAAAKVAIRPHADGVVVAGPVSIMPSVITGETLGSRLEAAIRARLAGGF